MRILTLLYFINQWISRLPSVLAIRMHLSKRSSGEHVEVFDVKPFIKPSSCCQVPVTIHQRDIKKCMWPLKIRRIASSSGKKIGPGTGLIISELIFNRNTLGKTTFLCQLPLTYLLKTFSLSLFIVLLYFYLNLLSVPFVARWSSTVIVPNLI